MVEKEDKSRRSRASCVKTFILPRWKKRLDINSSIISDIKFNFYEPSKLEESPKNTFLS